jgi:hypothetical protein
MKKFVNLLVIILIFSMGSLFVLKSPKGEPWLNVSDFYDSQSIYQKTTDLKNTVMNKAKSLIYSEPEPSIYKWQDEQGVWHYSDKKQSNSNVWVKPENLTIIPAIKPIDKKEDNTFEQDKKIDNSTLLPNNHNKIKDLINNTNNVQELMNNRTKNLDKQLEQH